MASARAMAGHRAVYRALLLLYPRSFRKDYGEPMVQLFADRLGDVGAAAWLRTTPDLIRTVPVERIEAVMRRLGPTARVLVLALAVVGAVTVSIGLGAGAAPLILLVVVALLFGQRRLFAALPGGDRAPLRHALVQAWWAPVAGLLGVAMLVVGAANVVEADNAGGRIVGTALLLAFGGAMLFGLMRRPFDRSAGNTLVLLATIPAFALWWLIVPPLAAIAIWVGVLAGGFEEPALA